MRHHQYVNMIQILFHIFLLFIVTVQHQALQVFSIKHHHCPSLITIISSRLFPQYHDALHSRIFKSILKSGISPAPGPVVQTNLPFCSQCGSSSFSESSELNNLSLCFASDISPVSGSHTPSSLFSHNNFSV